jgi:ureidoacrylate peracid hydrolase
MATLEEITLDGRNTALIVIDIVNDICSEGFRFEREGWNIAPIKKMIEESLIDLIQRSIGKLPIVYVKSEYAPRQFEDDSYPITDLCISGAKGAELYKLNPGDADLVFTKHHWSAFLEHTSQSPTELQAWLVERGIKTVVLAGVTTTHCIPTNIDHALRLGYEVILPRDCVSARQQRIEGPNGHNATIRKYEEHRKVIVVDSRTINYL